MIRSFFLGLAAALTLGAQTEAAPPVASNPVVELSGVIAEVHISPGQGMPYVAVKKDGHAVRIYLGAMHYLIAENFNPKTGQTITAKGYKVEDGVVGILVTLPAEKKTLKLRDEKGWPLWRGGMGHRRMQAAPAP
jgi:hypothetical protein